MIKNQWMRIWLMLSIALFLLHVPASARSESGQGFFYDSLALETPQSSIQQFCEAFAADDFVTCYFILGNEARESILKGIQYLQIDRMANPCALEGIDLLDPDSEHGVGSPLFLFALIMQGARDNGCLSVDLSGPAETREVDPKEISPDTRKVEVAIEALLPREEFPVVFSLYRSPAGKWRIQSVRYTDHAGQEHVWPASE